MTEPVSAEGSPIAMKKPLSAGAVSAVVDRLRFYSTCTTGGKTKHNVGARSLGLQGKQITTEEKTNASPISTPERLVSATVVSYRIPSTRFALWGAEKTTLHIGTGVSVCDRTGLSVSWPSSSTSFDPFVYT